MAPPLLLLIIKVLQILRNIVRGHVPVPIPFSPYITTRFVVIAVAVAARHRYRALVVSTLNLISLCTAEGEDYY